MPKYKYEKNTSWDALLATTAMYPNYDDIVSTTLSIVQNCRISMSKQSVKFNRKVAKSKLAELDN